MTGSRESRTGGRRRWPLAVALAALLCAAAVALPANAERRGDQTVEVSSTGLGAEKVKTVPIAKQAGGKTKVAMSLSPQEVGEINPGDAVYASAEIEVSVTCLEPIPQCVGKIYKFSPNVRARLVLADSPTATGKNNTKQIGKPTNLRCSQELPNRNHHCVVTADGLLRDAANLPCQNCNVNLLIDAFHKSAKPGHKLVVGTDQDNGQISQDKGMLNAAVFSPSPPPPIDPDVTRNPSTRKLPIGAYRGSGGPDKVIFSQRLNELKEDEQLIVDVRIRVKTKHLHYGALLQSQLVLSENPNSTRRNGVPAKVTTHGGLINAQNGFNCTPGKSGHKSPCLIHKVATIQLTKDARTNPDRGEGPFVPLFLNLVVSSKAEFGGQTWHAGDKAKVAKKGSLSITRFGPEFRP